MHKNKLILNQENKTRMGEITLNYREWKTARQVRLYLGERSFLPGAKKEDWTDRTLKMKSYLYHLLTEVPTSEGKFPRFTSG